VSKPTGLLVILLVFLLVLAFARWAFLPRHHVPVFRVLVTSLRLRLRLHPGRGFAIVPQLWAAWGRLASFRESRQARPSLGFWYRATHPGSHSVFCGRAQYFHGLRLAIQLHLTLFGPPRSGKTQFLARVILRYPGAVVSTTTKPDIFRATSGIRARRSGPVEVFNPQRLGGDEVASTIRWDPVAGCEDPTVATRRAQAFCEAVSTEGTEDSGFWQEQAGNQMRALLCAAALGHYDFSRVVTWILTGQTRDGERLLRAHGHEQWAATVALMRGKAERTTATIRLVLSTVVAFFTDPALAECVLPGDGPGFDIEEFLLDRGTLYLIGESRGRTSPIAPLFAGLVSEIHWTATQMAAGLPGGRLDPPVLFALDEVTQIVPVPLPSILADSGGRGIQIITACHGMSQLQERWGEHGAQAVMATTNLVLLRDIKEADTLDMVSRLIGDTSFRERGRRDGEDPRHVQHRIAPPELIRQLPRGRALILASGAPVIAKLPRVRRDLRYLLTFPRSRRVFPVIPAPAVRAAIGGLGDLETVFADGLAELDAELEGAAATMPVPVAGSGRPGGNGHGSRGAAFPWSRP
jgi:type IV secretion system protein VirD4